ncbi:MAG TPA: TerB family tellurite resistance protein [Gammaproteobacteria bacterium]|nr:TerB family tellurite resistance protein [Gammaproteobacteria bacterium]
MLKGLSDFFERAFGDVPRVETTPEARRHAVRVATALLLVEVARADFKEDIVEHERTLELLKEFFDLSAEEARLLVEEAKTVADASASLQQFTRRLHERLTVEEKHGVVEMLWKVALADDHLDKYEDHLVRKIAELLYVSHADLIRIRNRVADTTAN